ncbi:MAG: hypothetical protein IT461_12020 [Planctomycetes bacterium]|nr:hypothetical protein [Planctomycetota bacterium]
MPQENLAPKENSKRLIGRKIVKVTQVEPRIGERCYNASRMNPAFRIWLDDGTVLVPMADAEGNGPGVIQIEDQSQDVDLLWTNEISK